MEDWIELPYTLFSVTVPELRKEHIDEFFIEILTASLELPNDKITYYSGIISLEKIINDGHSLSGINFYSSQPLINGKINLRQRQLLENVIRLKKNGSNRNKVNEFKDLFYEFRLNNFENWSYLFDKLRISYNFWTYLSFRYNPFEKSLIIKGDNNHKINPDNFPKKVKTIDELFKIISLLLNEKHIELGQLEWFKENKEFIKILISAIDKKSLDFNKINIDQNSLVKWKYTAPEVELELENLKFVSTKKEESGHFFEIKNDLKSIKKYLLEEAPDINAIEKAIELSNKRTSEELKEYLDLAFKSSEIKNLDNFIELEEILNQFNQENDWNTKLKIGIPLLSAIGLNLETEFDLTSHLKNLKTKSELLAMKIQGII